MRTLQERDLNSEVKTNASQHWKKTASYYKQMDKLYDRSPITLRRTESCKVVGNFLGGQHYFHPESYVLPFLKLTTTF